MKDKITLWTPNEPEGYGICDQEQNYEDDFRAFVLDHSSLTDDNFKIIYDEEEEGFVCR
jgi:hypothetical protein